jgi:hypothetical protein
VIAAAVSCQLLLPALLLALPHALMGSGMLVI